MSRVPSRGATLSGIDTSHYEPGVSWDRVAKVCPFSITKATEGLSGTDSLFPKYWSLMKTNGIRRGAYHFFHPDQDAVAQAEHFLTVVGTLSPGDLAPILDWEVSAGVSSGAQIVGAKRFLDTVEQACGVVPIIYGSSNYLSELRLPASFSCYPLWIANYGVSAPNIPAPWVDWVFWQDTDSATVSGVPHPCDHNIFNGDLNKLKQYCVK